MKILIIDNYDSFTFNLYQMTGELLQLDGGRSVVDVVRNDTINIKEIKAKKYNRIIISPGPGNPTEKKYFGICGEVITQLGKTIPTLGVCLGMQGMAHYFGGRVIRAIAPMHGKSSNITHDGKGIFRKIPQHIEVMRYHSLVVDPEGLPPELEITALSEDTHEIMGLRHKTYPIEGVQFHPESFATEAGKDLLKNFISVIMY
jgi:anthranilate synthase component 2